MSVRRLLADVAWYGGAVLAALLVVALVLLALGANPIKAYAGMASASFGSIGGFGQMLNKTSPLLLGALGVMLAFRAGLLNIGVDGQIYMGATLATGAAFWIGPRAPSPLALAVVLLAGLAGGFLAAFPAALLRAVWNVNEIFVTVMLNFIFVYLVDYLATGPWNDPIAGEAITREIGANSTLPLMLPGGAHPGLLLGLGLALALGWFLRETVIGYEIRAAGENPAAARVGGVSLAWTWFIALGLSGAIAGLGGALEVSGYHHRLINGISPNYGLMAILIAVVGRRTVVGTVVASFGFAVLLVGGDSLQRSVGLPSSAALLFQAAILISLLLADVLRSGSVGGWWRARLTPPTAAVA